MATMAETAPKTGTEAMLWVQMNAVHDLALRLMANAATEKQYPGITESDVNLSVKLLRLFCEQTEMMQRLKGKATQQRVVVEHVHVGEGGHAIVGAVTAVAAANGQVEGGES